MTKELPAQPSLEQLKKQAKDLLRDHQANDPEALARFREHLPELQDQPESATRSAKLRLHDAQSVIAREYGFDSWARLKAEVEKRADAALKPVLEDFCRLVQRGAVEELRVLLAEHPVLKKHLDAPLFDFGSPAMRMAVNQKNLPLIEFLLEAGADINKRSEWEPGSFGVLDNVDPEFGQYLLEKGALLDVHSAAGLGKVAELREMLEAAPSLVNARGGDGGTPLHFAKNLEVVNLLLEFDADVTIRDLDHGSTAAMWQIDKKDILYRLIEAGSSIDIFMACYYGDLDLAKRALREDPGCLESVIGVGKFDAKPGGNIYIWKIGNGVRPLELASVNQHGELSDFLARQAAPTQKLIMACNRGDLEGARALLNQHPGLVENLSPEDARALPDAVWFGREEAVDAFIACGFPLDARGQDQGSLLHIAAWTGRPRLVRKFIDLGLDLEDRKDIHGSTPLGWACHGKQHCGGEDRDHLGCVKALLAAGANPLAPANKYGQESITDWATPEIMEAFQAYLPKGGSSE